MSLLRSLFAGVSGLQNDGVMMDVISNNIANINTTGFKAGRVTFSETFAQTLRAGTQPLTNEGGTNPIQVGLGVSLGAVDTMFTQGNIETTGQNTDLALQGDGFFIVNKDGRNLYTRDGEFLFDANGTLVDSANGSIVQGKMAVDGTVPAGTALQNIQIPNGQTSPATATTYVDFSGNLDAGATPTGAILQTGSIYADEDGSSNVEGLKSVSSGGTVTTIGDLSAAPATVSVTDGKTTGTYVYTTEAGNDNFHTLAGLAALIASDFGLADSKGKSDSTAVYVSGGKITLENTSDATTGADVTLSITSSNLNLQSALSGLAGTYTKGAGNTLSSDAFFRQKVPTF